MSTWNERIFAALVVAALPGCGGPAAPPAFEMPPAPVTVAAAVAKDVSLYLDEIGRCVASEVVTVMPQVSGKVTKIAFADGADLQVDTPLFEIDSRPYDARLAEAKARAAAATSAVVQARAAKNTAAARVATSKSKREEARAQSASGTAMAQAAHGDATSAASDVARANDDLKRMESMQGSGAISQQELVRSRTDASAAEARLAAARRREAAAEAQALESAAAEKSADDAIREAESQLAEAEARIVSAQAEETQATAAIRPAQLDVDFCKVASPIVGRAGRRMVDVGNVVTASVTALLSIQRYDPAHVEFTVTEKDLGAVQRSMKKHALKAEVRLPDEGRAAGPGAGEVMRVGDVVFLDNAVQDATGTIRMRVKLDNADGAFWPGRFARVRLLLDVLPGAVLVPASAPQASAHGPFVYVLKEAKNPKTGADELVTEMRPVALGQRHGELVAVDRGVAAGERVVVERQFFVYPGARVMVVEPPKPPAHGAEAPGAGK